MEERSETDLNVELALANLERCLSGAFYNVGVSLYQAGRLGGAVPFLKEAVAGGEKALALQRLSLDSSTEVNKEKEWNNLEEQIHKRWELLAVCYSKNGDRKVFGATLFASATRLIFNSRTHTNPLSNVSAPSHSNRPISAASRVSNPHRSSSIRPPMIHRLLLRRRKSDTSYRLSTASRIWRHVTYCCHQTTCLCSHCFRKAIPSIHASLDWCLRNREMALWPVGGNREWRVFLRYC